MKKRIHIFNLRFNLVLISILIYSLASAQWVLKDSALRKRSEVTSIVYNGKLYTFLGFHDSLLNVEPTSEVYDPVTNTWKLLNSLDSNKSVTHQGVALIDDNVWHIGGRVGKNPGPLTSEIWIYNITNNSWSPGPQIKDPATGDPLLWAAGGAIFLGRTLHIFGGFIINACNNDQGTYHLTLNVDDWLANPTKAAPWKNELAPLPIKRNHFGTVILGGKIYAIGGQFGHDCDGGLDEPYSHVYNPATNIWTQLPLLPTPRSHIEGSTFAIDGKIYIAGGQGANNLNTNKVTIFDPAGNNGAGSWTDNSNLLLPRSYEGLSAKVIVNTFIISHGGSGASQNPQKTTYSRTITRNRVYKLGFPSTCLSLSDSSASTLKGHTWLFTIDSTKNYSCSSNASWLVISKNATGITNQNAVDIEVTADTAGLTPGTYNATITATGTGGGVNFTPATLCVSLTIHQKHNLLVNINGNGTVNKNPDQKNYASVTNVTLTAAPGSGQQFTGWTGNATGNTNPLTITMSSDKVVTANFSLAPLFAITNITTTSTRKYALSKLKVGDSVYTDRAFTAATVPSNLLNAALIKTPNDDKYSTSSSLLSFDINDSATIYIAYDPSATSLPTWLSGFTKLTSQLGVLHATISNMLLYSKDFSKGKITLGGNLQSPAAGAQNNYLVIILPKVSPVQYSLNTTVNGNGSITKSPNQSTYSNGTMVSLTAIPAAGQQFTGWSSDASGTTNPLTVIMNSNKTITANFAAIQYSLTVSSSGSGSVSKNPDQPSYNSGTNVTLTATPVSGQKFTGWSGDVSGTTNPLTITMNSNKTITANFAIIQYSLTVSTSGNGTVSKSPDQALYNGGTKVILTATPGSGQQFTGWSGGASGATNPLTITMNSNKTITANFSAVPLSVSNIIATTGSSYTLGELTVGVAVYTDRTTQATSVPTSLNKAPFIKTPDDDRNNKSDTLLSFNINQDATIFIAYDPRAKNLPAWLSGWQKLTVEQVGINDSKISYLQLYSKNYAPGKVTIGGNLENPANGALNNYLVIALATQTSQPQYRLAANSNVKTLIKNEKVDFKVYPNPNPGNKIYIDADHFSKDENVTITILNTLGKTIKSVKIKTNQQGSLAANISLGTSLSKGLYIIKATTASGSFQKKLILN